MMTERRHAI